MEMTRMALSANYRPWRMPDGTPEHLAPAWAGCVSSAFGDPEVEEQFLAAMRDGRRLGEIEASAPCWKAVGEDEESVRRFIDWVNKNIWDRAASEVRRSTKES
jgi:hypothetical protein